MASEPPSGSAARPERSRSPAREGTGADAKDGSADGNAELTPYSEEFFSAPLDRESVYAVKYDLRGVIFGASAANAIPLWVADMDLPCAPEIVAALRKRTEHPTFGYTIQPTEMWQAAKKWLWEEHGWHVGLEDFVFCAGVVTATAAVLWAFTEPEDTVLLMTPLYEPLQKVVTGAKRRLKIYELALQDGKYCIDRARLAEALRGCKLLLFCNPHNPGGRVWDKQELQMVAELCRLESVILVSDEIWADWCLFGHKHRPLALEAADGQSVITLMSPTKTWNLAGLHCSYLVIRDQTLRDRYLSAVDYAFLHFGGTFATTAMIAAYNSGQLWLKGVRYYVEENLRWCKAFFQEHSISEVVPLLPEATYLLWLDCRGLGLSDPARFFKEEAGVILSCGREFGGEATSRFVRLNAAVSRQRLEYALGLMVSAIERQRQIAKSTSAKI